MGGRGEQRCQHGMKWYESFIVSVPTGGRWVRDGDMEGQRFKVGEINFILEGKVLRTSMQI